MEIASRYSPKFKNSFICCSPRETCSTPASSTSNDDSEAAPMAALEIEPTATAAEVRVTIAKCKDMVLNSAQCSTERAKLVRRLVELRLRLEEMQDDPVSPPSIDRCGHHFKLQSGIVRAPRCENCSGNIWTAVQNWYSCEACGYTAHASCVKHVIRCCAHMQLAERGSLDTVICPWIGLAAQDYKCNECRADLSPSNGNDARLCDYTGRFYCCTCHWGDAEPIPARVIHNWDWSPRPICRATKLLLHLAKTRQLIDIECTNPALYNFITELEWVQSMRRTLSGMRRYLTSCSDGVNLITAEFKKLSEFQGKYSMEQLYGVHNGTLEIELQEMTHRARCHITSCARCRGRGYLCEVCGNNEILFPFDAGAEGCSECNSYYHRKCWLRREKQCVKCERIKERRKNSPHQEPATYFEYDLDKWVN